MDGQTAAAGKETTAEDAGGAAASAPGTQVYYRDRSFFFPGPGPLLFLVPLFAFAMLFMGAARRGRHGRHRGWGSAYGPCGYGRGSWGPPPWKQGQDNPSEKSPDDIDDGPGEPIMQA